MALVLINKRVVVALLVGAVFILSACGGAQQQPEPPAPPPVTAEPEPEPAPEPVEQGQEATGEPEPSPEPEPSITWRVNENFMLETDDPVEEGKKYVMFTFDDGPYPGSTEQILDTLKQENIKAVFFVTGYGSKNEEILKRIADEGHTIGTHTMNHPNLRDLTKEEQRAEIVGVNEIVERVTGQSVKYVRPPFGAYNADTEALAEELGFEIVNWSHGSGDWLDVPADGYKDPAAIVFDVLEEDEPLPGMTPLHDRAVILMHDVHQHTADALPEIIQGLREKGYDFAVIR